MISCHAPGCRPAIVAVATRIAGIRPDEALVEARVKSAPVAEAMVSLIRPGAE
jgi:hypothetical protein